MSFPSFIQQLDERLFVLINKTLSNTFLDAVLVPVRDPLFWIPFYILIAAAMLYFYKKTGVYIILLLGLNFTISDQMSSAVIKPLVGRIRPCHDEQFKSMVILRIDACGHGKSFTSSHAANTFAFAMLLSLLFSAKHKWITPVIFFWASLVSYAQIYVGVHYPADVLGGALTGMLIAILVFLTAKKYLFHRIKFAA